MTELKTIRLTADEMAAIESYQKEFPNKHEEIISRTVVFSNGYEMDIKLCPCDQDTMPFAEAVLFHYGSEVCCSEPDEPKLIGTWSLSVEDHGETFNFIAEVLPGTAA